MIHLPISLTWREVHALCTNAHPLTTPILTYSAMRTHIKSHFSYVKLPKNSCLGKCSACIDFAQQRLRAKSPLEAAQFASAQSKHLSLSAAERFSYKERCRQAKSQPSSLIIDYSNPLPLPTHSPVPKCSILNPSFCNIRQVCHIKGLILDVINKKIWNRTPSN